MIRKAGIFLSREIKPTPYHIYRSGQTRLHYKGKLIQTKTSLSRIGVCNWCRSVMPFDCKTTQLHHEEYDDMNPEKHTIELCMSCHKSTMRGRGPNKPKKKHNNNPTNLLNTRR